MLTQALPLPWGTKELALQDPWQFLKPTEKMKIETANMPFDAKKMVWVPDAKEGYAPGEIKEVKGDMTTILKNGAEEMTMKTEHVQQMNPPQYEKCEDMSNLTYLNDASVLHNLRQRYRAWMIYTYSGLFCVVVNPYKRLPIYNPEVVIEYRGRRKNEVPPHLFAVSDNAYAAMIANREDQSMLITGESGAGKTENTKKVISYFAMVAASGVKPAEGEKKKANLEDQIVSANPVLESFGNAKTVRNDNSSRFGKFIRIHFGPSGKLAGADVESYLLEKSRVVSQQPIERSYHIFYQVISGAIDGMSDMLLLKDPIDSYPFVSQGRTYIDGVDDGQEMKDTDAAFDVLLFTGPEKTNIYKIVAAVMHMGAMQFKQRPREEQAEADGMEVGGRVAHLLGVSDADLYKGILKPRVKVGTEYVTKGQNKEQCYYGVSALAKAMFDRMFKWLVVKVNETLATPHKKSFFIGVLDIAGFEIFDSNGFEQICINFTNEKLQQFFNHHMFILEQEEYKREGIEWTFIDFGLDLQACIDMIEKPMGILAILEEESMFPKATDTTFKDKLVQNHLGKSKAFIKPKPPKKNQAEAHFGICHYAGIVNYNITAWLEKNKDPINDTVAVLLAKSHGNPLMGTLFADKLAAEKEESAGGKGKRKKGSAFQTVSAVYREQLGRLMHTLESTQPHFVRCLIPNENKEGGALDAELVINQLTCNGVLEGIRICRKGFPNRLVYGDFKQRYQILAPNAVPEGFSDSKDVSANILTALDWDKEMYRCGHTKVFFKAGSLGKLEMLREERITRIMTLAQAWIRGKQMREQFIVMKAQRMAMTVIQRNVRKYVQCRNWPWWKLYTKVKPLLSVARQEDEMKEMKDEFDKIKAELEKETKLRKEQEEQIVKLQKEKADLHSQVEGESSTIADIEERATKLIQQKAELEQQLADFQGRLQEEEEGSSAVSAAKKKVEGECSDLKSSIEDLERNLKKVESEKTAKEHQIKQLNDEIARQEELIAKVNKENKHGEENQTRTSEDLQKEEDKCNHLNKLKAKLEQNLDELEDNLEREKKVRGDVEKAKRKLEGDLKMTQEAVEELEHARQELEENIRRKDKEVAGLNSKCEDEQGIVHQMQKKIKELQARIEEVEEEVEAERQSRSKVEKQRGDAVRELEDLTERLEEAGGATSAQVELNKKREAELAKLRRDLEEQALQNESTISSLRKKQNDMTAEMGEQIDQLQKVKAKIEKEKAQLKVELDDAKANIDHVSKSKGQADKLSKALEGQLSEANGKLDEATRTINDLNTQKSRAAVENSDLMRQLEEAESQVAQLNRVKSQLSSQLEESRGALEDESRQRAAYQSQVRNAQHDAEQMREQLEEESESKSQLQRQLAKVSNEFNTLRARVESEGLGGGGPEADEIKRKMQAKLQNAEDTAESALSKVAQLEKVKIKLINQIDDMSIEVERASSAANAAEKKQRNFDKTVSEWKQKSDDLATELEASQRECRNISTELFKAKSAADEASDNIDGLRRENRNLADEIKDIADQLNEGGKSIHEVDKARRRAEQEKDELQSALEEAEAALEQEEAKYVRAQLELQQIRQEIDRRLAEKDEEFETTRRNHQRAIDSMQASLEAEAKGKGEVMRMKKKLETDINQLEVALDSANRQNADAQKNLKKLQAQMKDLESQIEDEQRQRDELAERLGSSERRCNSITAELEEARTALEMSERNRRATETELNEANDHLSDMQSQVSSANAAKRKLEGDLTTTQADLEETMNEMKHADEKARNATADAARLAEELRQEQDHAQHAEKARQSVEGQLKGLQVRLDEAEANVLKGGKKLIAKLEQRVRELEGELEGEQRRSSEAQKNYRKCDRQVRDLMMQIEDSKKNQAHFQDMIEKLTSKSKLYKRQIDEAEEVANMNLAKYRKTQAELEDTQVSLEEAEAAATKMRAMARAGGVTSRSTRSATHASSIE
ncbi:PREDICTED: myosin heavy chain, muscle-like isoform X1 [Priapulus caudatus]|uniref:Myosin heavy chain, muscle-like isoform X1 n=1 Tax=Priapulus caudatus TaxID=37621 RepID=A0ABM1DRW1_PRICU|nr:PREDICTED: myosin heavy chain, muscle-like isoform X1 [Priapulus caudatus]